MGLTPLEPVLALGACVIAIVLLVLLAPARVVIAVDTKANEAAARLRLLWGLCPQVSFESAKRTKSSRVTRVIKGLRDAPRLVHALLVAPKLLPVLRRLLSRLHRLKPEKERLSISLNLLHPKLNVVIAVAEELGGLPGVTISKRDQFGVDVDAAFVLRASPLRIWLIWTFFRTAPPTREFFRRLRKNPG